MSQLSNDVALLQQARALHGKGEISAAEALYLQLLKRNPRHVEAQHLLGVIALQCGQLERAVSLISGATSLDPLNVQAHANLGSALFTLKRWEEALAEYDRALEINPHFAAVHHNRGTALQMLGQHDAAVQSFEHLLKTMPEADFVLGNLCHSRSHVCDWTNYDASIRRLVAGVQGGRRVARPFAFLSSSASAADQLQCARTYASYVAPHVATPLWRGERYTHDRIRVAYISTDFRDHIVSHLMAPVYESHDKTHFYTVGVSIGTSDTSAVVIRAKAALDSFIDLAAVSDAEAAGILREREIDIAVDLTGHTLGARPGIFARRFAPVQVNYLGYPGTLGGMQMDYILADEFVIPAATQRFYSEKVVSLPDTFQSNDGRRALAAPAQFPTRAAAGLPDSALVLCCFNNSYKITPALFDVWARVLNATPTSVLWLLAARHTVEARLRDAAKQRGLSAERLIFAPRLPYDEHLARLSLADLYLDTLPFNGGASAGDVLWAGVPLLTVAGEAFASRMAGSLLHAAGLPELVTYSLEDYERHAVDLAADPQRLARYKTRLSRLRSTVPLFDSRRFSQHLEQAYRAMWERARRGQPPASLSIAPLDSVSPSSA